MKSSDLVPRGYGEIKDFFKIDNWEGDIVTNPPYTEALEFVSHALKITQEGAKIAMLLRLQFLEGSKRYLKLFKTDPPKYVYLFVKRQKCFKNGISEPVGGVCGRLRLVCLAQRLKNRANIALAKLKQ